MPEIAEDLRGLYDEAMMRSEQQIVAMRPSLVQELIERTSTAEARVKELEDALKASNDGPVPVGQKWSDYAASPEGQLEYAMAEIARLKAPVRDGQTVWFHGTSQENAKSIALKGFREGTWFARNMETAVAYGGPYVFSVRVSFDVELERWQVCCANALAPCQIEKLTIVGEEKTLAQLEAEVIARAQKGDANDPSE